MSANPDPLDDKITGLEPGGGVPPGETPPGESQTSWSSGHDEGGPRPWVMWGWLGAILLVVVAVVVMFLAYAGSLFVR
jgi:hypothetical protein